MPLGGVDSFFVDSDQMVLLEQMLLNRRDPRRFLGGVGEGSTTFNALGGDEGSPSVRVTPV